MINYDSARIIGKIVSSFGWLSLVIGIVGLIILVGSGQVGIFFLPMIIGIILGGLLIVVQGQLLQAQIDTASNTSELIRMFREPTAQVETASNADELVRLFRELNSRLADHHPVVASADSAENTYPLATNADFTVGSLETTVLRERRKLDPDLYMNKYRGYKIHSIRDADGKSFKVGQSLFSSLNEAADFIDQVSLTPEG